MLLGQVYINSVNSTERYLNHLVLFDIKGSKQVVGEFFQHYETQLEILFYSSHL